MNPLPKNWVEEIFKRFHGRFGNRFLAEYSTGKIGKNTLDEGIENAKKVWGEELAGFTPEEIKRGLSAQYDYLPDCDKFKVACRPTIDLERAFYEAVDQMHRRKEAKDKWSSAIIYWAAATLGNDLKNFPYASIKVRWKAAIDKARQKIIEGSLPNEVPPKLVAIPAPGKTTISREEAAIRMEEVYAVLNKKIINGVTKSE
ncbi:MAG: hypothetical protein K2Q13_10330 [Nitrosomonas sp.]|uniref:hypothetical protein n=1 Tax=Nitrosomonas sp. TaxID=42353 RepID=UPI0025EA6AFB|nr:hypothetical protein [Nitrosomonas sp.]MBY0475438.1 hypothetical protein [Nitrosomonas sp.]